MPIVLEALARRDEVLPDRPKRYTWRFLANPFNLYMCLSTAAFALITGHYLILPVAAGLELAAVAIVPRLKGYRKCVDENEAEIEASRKNCQIDDVMMRMTDSHRAEFDRMRAMVEAIRESDRLHGEVEERILERTVLDRMVADYARLAIRYKECACALATHDKRQLEDTAETIDLMKAVDARDAAVLDMRRQVVKRHLKFWGRTRNELAGLANRMAAITEAMVLAYAGSIVRTPVAPSDSSVDDLDEAEGVVKELTEFSAAKEEP